MTPRSMGGYFGEAWPSGVCDTGEEYPTPIGEPCVFCHEPIAAGDRGSFMGLIGEDAFLAIVPIHRECSLRSVLGGIGHHEDHARWCRLGDPDGGRTKRQSSLEVWERIVGGTQGGER